MREPDYLDAVLFQIGAAEVRKPQEAVCINTPDGRPFCGIVPADWNGVSRTYTIREEYFDPYKR